MSTTPEVNVQSNPTSAVGWSPAAEHFGERYSVNNPTLEAEAPEVESQDPEVVSYSVFGGDLDAVVNVLGGGDKSREQAEVIATAFGAIVVPVVDFELSEELEAAIEEHLADPWSWVEVGDRIEFKLRSTAFGSGISYRITVVSIGESHVRGVDYDTSIDGGETWTDDPTPRTGLWSKSTIVPESIQLVEGFAEKLDDVELGRVIAWSAVDRGDRIRIKTTAGTVYDLTILSTDDTLYVEGVDYITSIDNGVTFTEGVAGRTGAWGKKSIVSVEILEKDVDPWGEVGRNDIVTFTRNRDDRGTYRVQVDAVGDASVHVFWFQRLTADGWGAYVTTKSTFWRSEIDPESVKVELVGEGNYG